MKEYQLKIDLFDIRKSIIEEPILILKKKQDSTAKVDDNKGFAKDIVVRVEEKEEEKEEIKEIKF